MSQPDAPLRALIIAEAANPEWVSVPLEGWSHSLALMQHPAVEAHVVTQVRNREAIERAGWTHGQEFTAIDSEAMAKPFYLLGSLLSGGKGKGWTTLAAFNLPAYYYFERLVWRRFAQDLRAGRFDVVHRLTPLSPTSPSTLARRCVRVGVPFTLGPLNGGVPWPKGFDRQRRQEREWLSYVRQAHWLMPHQRATRRHAAAVIVGSRDTLAQEPRNRRHKYVYIPENAIDPARFTKHRTHQATRPLRLVHVGRLVPYKGADMLLEAAAPLIRDGAVSVDLIGEGPHRPELERIIQHLGIQDGAVLRGQVPHEQLQDELIQYDVLAFPSIREFGGAVVLEAMSLGLVPIIVDYAGPAELVDEHTGFKVPIGPREQIVAGFRDRIQRLVDDPASIEAIGPRCRQRVFDYFTWQAKAEQTYETWRWVTGRRPDKPDFGMPLGGPAAEPKLAEL